MAIEAEKLLIPVVQDPRLPAFEKLQQFFRMITRWMLGQKAFLLSLLRVWYTDDNAIMRQKVQSSMLQRVAPLSTAIINQGVEEEVFNIPFPDQVSMVLMALFQGYVEQFAHLLFKEEQNQESLESIERSLAAYEDALERILGASSSTLGLVDIETLNQWFAPAGETGHPFG